MKTRRSLPLCCLKFMGTVGLLWGCAAPVDSLDQRFVAPRELRAVSYAGEGLAALRRSRFQDAELYFRRAHYLYPDAANITFNLADALVRNGLYDEAVGLYQELLVRDPDDLGVHHALVRAYQQSGDRARFLAAIEETFKRAMRLGRFDVVELTARLRANEALERGDLVAARCHSATAFQLNQSKAQLMQALQVLFASNRLDLAEALLQEWLVAHREEVATDVDFSFALALSAVGRGDDTAARQVVKSVLLRPQVDPQVRGDLELLGALSHAAISGSLPLKKDQESGGLSDRAARELLITRGRTDSRWFGWPARYVGLILQWASVVEEGGATNDNA